MERLPFGRGTVTIAALAVSLALPQIAQAGVPAQPIPQGSTSAPPFIGNTATPNPVSAPEPPRDYAGAAACDTEAYGTWCRALLARGVYPPASQFEAVRPQIRHVNDLGSLTLLFTST